MQSKIYSHKKIRSFISPGGDGGNIPRVVDPVISFPARRTISYYLWGWIGHKTGLGVVAKEKLAANGNRIIASQPVTTHITD
jgi:hypothetical protein